jgi:hypothetical protein
MSEDRMTAPRLPPSTHGECVEFLDPPRVVGRMGVPYNCRAYKITVSLKGRACRTEKAVKR